MIRRAHSLTVIKVPTTQAGSTGTIFTQSGVDVSNFRGRVAFVFSARTSSTAGATDKCDAVVQHHTGSAHGDADWTDVTGVSFVRNVTGSMQILYANADALNQYVRLKTTNTGTFAVGLSVVGDLT
jgi:hypothetical protein